MSIRPWSRPTLIPLDFRYDAMATAVLDGRRRDSPLVMKKLSIQLPKLSHLVVARLVERKSLEPCPHLDASLLCNFVAVVSCDAMRSTRLLGAMVPVNRDGDVDSSGLANLELN
jgi:hypothetical protein